MEKGEERGERRDGEGRERQYALGTRGKLKLKRENCLCFGSCPMVVKRTVYRDEVFGNRCLSVCGYLQTTPTPHCIGPLYGNGVVTEDDGVTFPLDDEGGAGTLEHVHRLFRVGFRDL